jgi:hypothetical protein
MDNWHWAMTFDPLHMCEDRKTYAFISGYNAGTLNESITMMVNKSFNINKTNNYLSLQILDHKKDHDMI